MTPTFFVVIIFRKHLNSGLFLDFQRRRILDIFLCPHISQEPLAVLSCHNLPFFGWLGPFPMATTWIMNIYDQFKDTVGQWLQCRGHERDIRPLLFTDMFLTSYWLDIGLWGLGVVCGGWGIYQLHILTMYTTLMSFLFLQTEVMTQHHRWGSLEYPP